MRVRAPHEQAYSSASLRFVMRIEYCQENLKVLSEQSINLLMAVPSAACAHSVIFQAEHRC
jgi:hypothetical protein